jgi:hypothetical protein
MVRSWLRIVLTTLALSVAALQSATADEPIVIADTDAAAHVGQIATVQGFVASVYVSQKGNAFLNFERSYPNEIFSGVIFAPSVAQFGDVTKYQGKQVRVTGQITLYKGRPEIILRSPDQLQRVQ